MKTINVKLILAASLLLSCAASSISFADTSIIVHPSNTGATDTTTMQRIFLGKVKVFDGGAAATPVELAEGNPTRTTFNSGFLEKTDAQMKSYWGRLVFTGAATAPLQAASNEAMVESVANNPNLIGYVDSASVTAAVKVVHTF